MVNYFGSPSNTFITVVLFPSYVSTVCYLLLHPSLAWQVEVCDPIMPNPRFSRLTGRMSVRV